MSSSMRMLGSFKNGVFLPVLLILGMQATATRMLSIEERPLSNPGLHELPMTVGHWHASSEGALESAVSEYLKPDEYILRDYFDQRSGTPINLFVAYFKSLQNAYGPHSPRVCLPGSGWLERASSIQLVKVAGREQAIPVNEYVMERGNERIRVFYWYQNNRNSWADEFRGKLNLLPDLIRYKRSDVSLVRLITPQRVAANESASLANCLEFTKLVFPSLVERFGSVE